MATALRAQAAEREIHSMTSAVLAATQNTHWFGGQASAIPGVLNFPFGTGSSATDYTSRDDRSYNGSSSSLCHGRALIAPQAGSCKGSMSRTFALVILACARTSARSSAHRCAPPRAAPHRAH
jgi:hypothetical protein